MTTLNDLNGYLDDEAYTVRVGELRALLSASIADTAGAKYESPVTFDKWADDYGFYDTATDVHQYARACAKDAWEMATRVANYPAKPGDLVQCEHCEGWSVEAPPAPSVADAAGREKELVEIIRRSHRSAASDNAAGASDKPLTDAQIEAGWRQTFSTENPYCPCNLKSFTKAVRWAERAKESSHD